jgi:indole-3-glycerol phosphate synthase
MLPPRYLIGEATFILRAAIHLTQRRRDSGESHYKPDQQIEARLGVNNRNLSTLEVSLDMSVEVASAAPEGVLLVSENGLRARKHLRGLRALGYKGFIMWGSPISGDLTDGILRDLP